MRHLLRSKKLLFIICGAFNFIISNSILLLLLPRINTSTASGISVGLNFFLGYILNRNFVFQKRKQLGQGNFVYFYRYLVIAIGSWIIYMISIPLLHNTFQVSKKVAAIILIPFLTVYSYLSQSRFVFK